LKFRMSLECLLDKDLENVPNCRFYPFAIAKVDIAKTNLDPQCAMYGLNVLDDD
jgi:hypothetical protein